MKQAAIILLTTLLLVPVGAAADGKVVCNIQRDAVSFSVDNEIDKFAVDGITLTSISPSTELCEYKDGQCKPLGRGLTTEWRLAWSEVRLRFDHIARMDGIRAGDLQIFWGMDRPTPLNEWNYRHLLPGVSMLCWQAVKTFVGEHRIKVKIVEAH